MDYIKNQDSVSNLNIEKAILGTILFDPNLFSDVFGILSVDNFTHNEYKKIFATMQDLEKHNIPIDDEMIKRKSSQAIDENVLVELLGVNPVSNIVEYAKELKKDTLARQIYITTIELQQKFDIKLIDKLQNLKDELENVDSIKKLKKTDTLDSFFDKIDLDYKKVEEAKFEYLLDNFIVKNEITMIAARPNIGKSLTTFAAANMVLENKSITTVFYLDGDNGITTIKERKIHHIKQKWGKKLRYIQGRSSNEFYRVIKELRVMDLTNCLVVFDSIKNFMFGGDRDKNKDVSRVMEVLKALRNNGATVIFLHHSNKPQKDIDELMYAGSSAWEEDTSNAYILKKNDDKGSFIFVPIKKRAGELHEQAYTYDGERFWLNRLDIEYAKQTKEDEEMIKETVEFLKSSRNKPMWSELWKNLTELGCDKEKASKVIKNGEGKLWKFERGDRNNQKLYSLIEADTKSTKGEPIETVFEFEDKKTAPRTPITPRSLFNGISCGYRSVAVDSDNSENSNISNFTTGLLKTVPRNTQYYINKEEDFDEKISMPNIL